MQTKQAEDLVKKYLSGSITKEEQELLEYWFHQHKSEDVQDFSAAELAQLDTLMWAKIAPKPSAFPTRQLTVKLAVAASFLICSLLTWYFFDGYQKYNSSKTEQTVEIVPGKNKAILKLSDGRMIEVDQLQPGLIATENHAGIQKLSTGELQYARQQGQGKAPYNTLYTPRGGQYTLVLSDGSKVIMNAESSLKYPAVFTGEERIVELTGEAYFEVARDRAHPFIVATRDQRIKVLGTHFNVRTYTDESLTGTTLLEGSVQISSGTSSAVIKPGQQALTTSKGMTVFQADVAHAIAWKEGYFSFKNQKISEVMKVLSRWYDFEVAYADQQVDDEAFNGRISKFQNIHQILKMLEKTEVVHFKIQGRRVIVNK